MGAVRMHEVHEGVVRNAAEDRFCLAAIGEDDAIASDVGNSKPSAFQDLIRKAADLARNQLKSLTVPKFLAAFDQAAFRRGGSVNDWLVPVGHD